VSDEIQQNRYDQLLRRVAGIIGPGSKVSQVITELFPMIDVENLPGELFLLSGTRLAFGGTNISGGVGNFASIQLFNPVDSENIMTLQTVMYSSLTADTVLFRLNNVALTTNTVAQRNRDSRVGIPSLAIGEVRREALGAATGAGQARVLANTTLLLNDKDGVAVLAPGTGFEITSATANTQIFVTFYWRERPAQPSELNF